MVTHTFLVEQYRVKRPLQFTVLCVLAFVFAGATLLFSMVGLFTFPATPEIFGFLRFEIFPAEVLQYIPAIISISVFLLASFAFAGLLGAWRLQKPGYWLFCCSMILLLFLPFVAFRIPPTWVVGNLFPYMIVALMLIVLLGFNLKVMR